MLWCLQIPVPDSVSDESASQFLVNPGEQQPAQTYIEGLHILEVAGTSTYVSLAQDIWNPVYT